jgi:hypothetical protein
LKSSFASIALHLKAAWESLEEDWLKSKVDEIYDRIEAVIAAGGGHTKY